MTSQEIIDYKVSKESQSNKKLFDDVIKGGHFQLLGTFENEHGELFVMHKITNGASIFLTGDEFDWEMGWKYNGVRSAYQEITLTKEEAIQAKEILSV